MTGWKKVENIPVDTAQVIIVDPHYVLPREEGSVLLEAEQGLTFSPLTEDYLARQYIHHHEKAIGIRAPMFRDPEDETRHINGLGVLVNLEGDGMYPVYIFQNSGDEIAAVLVVFKQENLPDELHDQLFLADGEI